MLVDQCDFLGPGTTVGSSVEAKAPADSESFLSIVFSGGILGIAIMLALIGLSLVTVYLIIDQALTLRRKDILPGDFAESIRQLLAQED